MEDNIYKQVREWGTNLARYRLPRWENLPLIDLYMDQVVSLVETYLSVYSESASSKMITPSIINNYVKLNIIPAPIKKKYSREHIAYILMICIMKPVMSIASIKQNIELQLKLYPLDEVFNQFCDMFEQTTKSTLISAGDEAEAFTGNMPEFLQKLSIRAGVQANASKMIAEKILSMYGPESEKK